MTWVDLVRGSIRETYGYASLLTGRDEDAAVSLVRQAYATLAEARRQGVEVDAVGKALRRVVRKRWIAHLVEVPPEGRAHNSDSRVLADLPVHVRTIVVLRTIDGMGAERVARETGVAVADVDRLYDQARTWLGADGADTGREWVHSRLGALADVPTTLVESLVTEFGTPRSHESARVVAYSVGVGELDATPPRGRVVETMDPTSDVVRTADDAAASDDDAHSGTAGESADVSVADEAPTGSDDSGETRRRRGLRRLLALR